MGDDLAQALARDLMGARVGHVHSFSLSELTPEHVARWIERRGWTQRGSANSGTYSWLSPTSCDVQRTARLAQSKDDPFFIAELIELIAAVCAVSGQSWTDMLDELLERTIPFEEHAY